MCEIIRQWIQEKLGIIISLNPESFCEMTKDGYLLSRILRSYEVINAEQFKMIEKSNVRSICLRNYEQHLYHWLKRLNIELTEEDISNIIDCKGLSSLSVIYRVFLELHEKDCLTFITKNRLCEKLHPNLPKYTVQKVKEGPTDKLQESKYKGYLNNSYDVVHWLQDRLEMVVSKCKSARENYLNVMRSTDRRFSNGFSMPAPSLLSETTNRAIDQIPGPKSEISINMTYEELLKEKQAVRKKKNFQPNYSETEKIMSKLKDKVKAKGENQVFMKELQKHIIKSLWNQLVVEQTEDFNNDVTANLLKQSSYEKQMQKKLREIKHEKKTILQSKQLLVDMISKQKEAEFIERLVERDEQFNKADFQYYLERERALDLHRAIYKEKLRLKAERTFNLCQDAIKGICNMAIRLSEYKSYFGQEPTERILDNWRKMVTSGHDIEEKDVKLEEVLGSEPHHLDIIVCKEIEKQNVMDQKDFNSYISFEWPWILQNVPEEEVKEMNNGMNILGHLVHLLLNLKYPLPKLPTPPNLPNVNVRVCVNGLPDLTYLQLLQKMLSFRGILVIELQDVINYCINAYKQEELEETDSLDEEQEIILHNNEKYHNIGVKGEKSKGLKNYNGEIEGEVEIKLSDKCMQTPKLYPGEKTPFTPTAALGKIAYNELCAGNYLTDFLMVSMFIEYVKVQEDNIRGWVLINYPTNFEQAILFEEAISGLEVPGVAETSKIFKSLTDIVYMCEPPKNEEPDERRFSKLLVNPAHKREPPPYDTVLTAFVNVRQAPEINSDTEIPKEVEDMEDSSKLQQFYTDQGCNYSVYYENFDYFTVKHLAKLIIGDFSLPPKSSVELFGDTIRYLDAEKGEATKSALSLKHGEKKESERVEIIKQKPSSLGSPQLGESMAYVASNINGKKPARNSTIITRDDKWTQIPELLTIIVEEEEPPEPGEAGWNYENLLVPEEIGLVLAEIWENMEEIYINDLSQVFFEKRTILNNLMPYVEYTKDFVRKYIMKPDQRQLYLGKFQKIFNEFNDDFRRDKEFKAEVHCLIKEMANRLLDITDIRMMRAERQRQDLIRESWGPKNMIELLNNYIIGFQIELDRHTDTMTFINDYFTGLITQMPCEEVFPKEMLPKFALDNPEIEKDVNTIFLYVDNTSPHPLTVKIETLYRKALSIIEKCEIASFTNFEMVKSMFLSENGNGKPKAIKISKPRLSIKGGFLSVFEPSEKIKQHFQYIFDGWLCALKGELARIKIRLRLLKNDLTENTDVILNTLKNALHTLYEENRFKYENEVNIINKACHILAVATERELPIQEEMLLTDQEFLIDPENILFPDPEEDIPEPPDGLLFTVSQLNYIFDVFFDLAPSGLIIERTFTFLLQDIILNNDQNLAPAEWTKLSGPNMGRMAKDIFGPTEYVYWKDFIIYNLFLPFPTVKQLIDMRHKFTEYDPELTELIKLECCEKIKFWFETDETVDYTSIRQLLFKMYKISQDTFNYTALLFDFCKGDKNTIGVAKAVGVISERSVCWDEVAGQKFVTNTLEQRQIHEEQVRRRTEERNANVEFATTIVDNLIDKTVHECDSVVITELLNEETKKHRVPNESKISSPSNQSGKEQIEGSPGSQTTEAVSSASGSATPETTEIQQFSNVAIGYEVKSVPTYDYFIIFEDIVTVMTRALIPKLRSKIVENLVFFDVLYGIFESCRNPNFNNQVLSHEFLNNAQFLQLLEKTKKFLIVKPYQLVENFLIELQLREW